MERKEKSHTGCGFRSHGKGMAFEERCAGTAVTCQVNVHNCCTTQILFRIFKEEK